MKAGVRVVGVGSAIVQLRNIGEKVAEGARKRMHRSAEIIVEQAKINVPEDDELLKNSIRIEKSYGVRRRLQIDIVAGGQVVMNPDGRMVNIDDYAALVHEDYEGSVANVKGPGEKTKKKMAAHPGRVGSKFLERAAADEEKNLAKQMIGVVAAIVGSNK